MKKKNTFEEIIRNSLFMFDEKCLKKLRKSKGLTQEEVAEKLCISQSAYARLENGSCKTWGVYLIKLCEVYNVSPIIFINDNSLKNNDLLNKELCEKKIIIQSLENKISNLEIMVSILEKK